ncbi:MAG TPA: XopAH/AvrB family type III secretion system effector [Burkholderiaceae bacterium]|nr:XopAH/AvrB family type III secretion system effector [Burkholderiaceae bacterium]
MASGVQGLVDKVVGSASRIGGQGGSASRSATGLPGPSRAGSLSRQERSLVGVARWRDTQYNTENTAAQQAYGQAFWEASRSIGAQISSGQARSLRDVWSKAREWRSRNAGSLGAGFDTDRDPMSERITPLAGQYDYIRRAYSSRSDGQVEQSWSDNLPPSRHFRMEDTIDGQPVRLTSIVMSLEPDADRNSMRNTNLRSMGYRSDSEPYHIAHTPASEVSRIMAHAETLYSRATDPSASNEQSLTTLAELHWWTAHAMPDERGSAAKAELTVRSIAQSRGMDLPPFRKGFVPDLEAMTTSRSEFVEKYPAMFEWKSTSWRQNE